MRFTIEIPDELFHAGITTAPDTVTVSKPDEASEGISGGAAPGAATGLTANVGQMRGGVSAGAAEPHLFAGGPVAAEGISDGGAAPGSVAD
jgi:hypothetical protein